MKRTPKEERLKHTSASRRARYWVALLFYDIAIAINPGRPLDEILHAAMNDKAREEYVRRRAHAWEHRPPSVDGEDAWRWFQAYIGPSDIEEPTTR